MMQYHQLMIIDLSQIIINNESISIEHVSESMNVDIHKDNFIIHDVDDEELIIKELGEYDIKTCLYNVIKGGYRLKLKNIHCKCLRIRTTRYVELENLVCDVMNIHSIIKINLSNVQAKQVNLNSMSFNITNSNMESFHFLSIDFDDSYVHYEVQDNYFFIENSTFDELSIKMNDHERRNNIHINMKNNHINKLFMHLHGNLLNAYCQEIHKFQDIHMDVVEMNMNEETQKSFGIMNLMDLIRVIFTPEEIKLLDQYE